MDEWRPEALPVGSVVLVIGGAATGKTVLMLDIVQRMQERYVECVVAAGANPQWAAAGLAVDDGEPADVLRRMLVPGPDRLCCLEDVHRCLVSGLCEQARRCRVTVIISQQWPTLKPEAIDCCVSIGRRGRYPRVDAYFDGPRRATGPREADVAYRGQVWRYQATRATGRWCSGRWCWEAWRATDARRWSARALPVGRTPVSADLLQLVVRHAPVQLVARTCRQWRRAVDDVPRWIETRHSARVPGDGPNIWRAPGVEWDGVLRII